MYSKTSENLFSSLHVVDALYDDLVAGEKEEKKAFTSEFSFLKSHYGLLSHTELLSSGKQCRFCGEVGYEQGFSPVSGAKKRNIGCLLEYGYQNLWVATPLGDELLSKRRQTQFCQEASRDFLADSSALLGYASLIEREINRVAQ